MKSASADDLLPDELAALMHFYAEAGVAWLSEDLPIDRLAEFAAPAVEAGRPVAAGPAQEARAGLGQAERLARPASAPPMNSTSAVAVPDAEAVESARSLAAASPTSQSLMAAVEAFQGCNLKFSARHTVFAAGSPSARVVVVGGAPAAEDDREGRPFSGVNGRILDRMMSGIGLEIANIMLVNTIPWRPPGDRALTVREVEICAPFARRLIELVRPDAVLVLGNLAARILSDEPRAGIHGIRGKWFTLDAASDHFRAFATFHPEELVATPSSKRLAWQDLLHFRADLGAGDPASPPGM